MSSACPQCHSRAFKRNGYTRHGKQNHRCLDCGRQFSLEPYYYEDGSNEAETLQNILNDSISSLKDLLKC